MRKVVFLSLSLSLFLSLSLSRKVMASSMTSRSSWDASLDLARSYWDASKGRVKINLKGCSMDDERATEWARFADRRFKEEEWSGVEWECVR